MSGRALGFGLWALAGVGLGLGCSVRPHVHACTDDLTGAWIDGGGHHWMLLDHRGTVEGYPIFADTDVKDGVLAAPRVIDLQRAGAGLTGHVTRRFAERGDECDARALVEIATCRDDTLQVLIGEPAAPAALAPCRAGREAAPRIERWQRD